MHRDKPFRSSLQPSPVTKISGGKVLSAGSARSANRPVRRCRWPPWRLHAASRRGVRSTEDFVFTDGYASR